jgi:hypothetical protein
MGLALEVVVENSRVPEHWGSGRLGIVTRNEEYLGRCVLVCPAFPDQSQFVVYIAADELTESFWPAEHLGEVVDDLGIVWISQGAPERQVERSVFDIRDTFESSSGPAGSGPLHGPSSSALEAGQRIFAGRVQAGHWLGYDVVVSAYEQRRFLRAPRTAGFLVEFLLIGSPEGEDPPSWDEGEDPPSWGEADYTAETIDELRAKLKRSRIQWVAPAQIDDFLRKHHPYLFGRIG